MPDWAPRRRAAPPAVRKRPESPTRGARVAATVPNTLKTWFAIVIAQKWMVEAVGHHARQREPAHRRDPRQRQIHARQRRRRPALQVAFAIQLKMTSAPTRRA